jgi:hypothetical protein
MAGEEIGKKYPELDKSVSTCYFVSRIIGKSIYDGGMVFQQD